MKNKVKKVDIVLAVTIICCISISLILFPIATTDLIIMIRNKSMEIFSSFYLVVGFIVVLFCIYLCLSSYGNIKLSEEKPEYSTISWLIMIFCTGMGSNLLYWSAVEWIYYYKNPPLNVVSQSGEAIKLAATYGSFHWSITGWAIYSIGAITLGLRYYNLKKPGLCLASCCDGACKAFTKNKLLFRILELIFLFGTIGGYTTMISFVVPMYSNNLAFLFGFENNFLFKLILVLIITVIFTSSACLGLDKGIKKISKINVFIAIILIFGIVLLGPTMFIIKSTINSIEFIGENFIMMSLWTDFLGDSMFPEKWTAFYWAWWLGLAPSMWIFISKISKGRSVREILSGVIASGSLGCWLCFGGITNFGIYQQITGKINLVRVLEELGPEQVISKLIVSLPFGKIILLIWTITGIIFLITTMDSGAYILSISTTLKIKENQQPSKKLRIFWSILLIIFPIVLIYTKSPMEALQASTVLTAVPIALLFIFTLISGLKYLKIENKKEN